MEILWLYFDTISWKYFGTILILFGRVEGLQPSDKVLKMLPTREKLGDTLSAIWSLSKEKVRELLNKKRQNVECSLTRFPEIVLAYTLAGGRG